MARASAGRWVARLLVALLALFVLVQAWFAAQVLWVRWQPPRETAFMAQRLAELREKDPKATIKFQWVPYERISTHLKRAVIAAEDAKFLEHEGFDWEGIAKAREKNERRGRVVAGGSTITQQLAKNLFLSPSKSYVRKGQEAIIALMLEAFLPKRAHPRALPERDRVGQRRVRRRGRGEALFRRPGRPALGRAGRAARRDDPVAAPLRAQSRIRVPRRPRRDDPRAHAGGRGSVSLRIAIPSDAFPFMAGPSG